MSHFSTRLWLFPVVVLTLIVSTPRMWLKLQPMLDQSAEPAQLSPEEVLFEAWQSAIDSGTYEYDTTVEHTQYPAPKLTNSGRQPSTDYLAIAGQIDQEQDLLEMTLWQDSGRHPDRGVSIKVEDGMTLGRVGGGEWEQMDDLSSLFAPGRDLLGFLKTIKNVAANGQESRQLGDYTVNYDRYTFELDSDAYASHMEQQMREHLQQFGSLPPGIRFSTADIYAQAIGTGEIWLDENGLPVRMTINLDVPAHRETGRAVSDITTDFIGFDQSKIESAATVAALTFWDSPKEWVNLHKAEISNGLEISLLTILVAAASALAMLLIFHYWHTRQFHLIMSLTLVLSMIVPQMIRAEQAHAFGDNLSAYERQKTAEREEATALQDAKKELQTSTWDPHTSPLESDVVKADAVEVKQSLSANLALNTSEDFVDSDDSDGDGLSNADEELWGTCAYTLNSTEYNSSDVCDGVADPTDTDGDTLTDGIEVNDLGSSPLYSDTDQDGLADNLEIGGFEYNGQTWYPAFNDDDTNNDGILDGAECLVWFEASEGYDANGVCPDTDGDLVPDLFDGDNDNDGVPDDQDLSVNTYVETDFDYENPFLFSAENLEEDKVVLLDMQFRPKASGNLNLYNHVLDWPTNDTDGQITRYLDTTWASTENSAIQSNDDNAANGDIRLVPMLEITMPYTDSHYASLPITATASADRVLGESVDTWIDTDQLDPFSITVEDLDTDSGDLVAYVPIVPVTDEYDGTVAYASQMLYRPTQGTNGTADWGAAHEFRVVWLVQMITDECINEDDDPDTCEREDVMTVIHSYYETWELTGLNASEEHGLESAIVYEDPAQDADLNSDDQLWLLSWNLGNTFMRGRDCEILDGDTCASNTDGERDVTVANLDSSIDGWITSDRYLEVDSYSYEHSSYMSYLVATEATSLLDNTFTSYASSTIPTLMYLHESEARSMNLDDDAFNISNSLTLDFDPFTVQKATMAYMSWTPYDYVGGAWTSHDTESYLDILEARLELDDYFDPADDSDTSEYEASGKVLWAQMYYAALLEGATAQIELDSSTVFNPVIDGPLDEIDYEGIVPDGATTGISSIMAAYANSYLKTARLKGYFAAVGKEWAQQSSLYTFSLQKQFKSGFYISYSTNILTGLVLRTALIGAALLAIGYFSGNDTVFRIGVVILSVVTIIVTSVYAINAVKAIYTAYNTVSKVSTASRIYKAATDFGSTGAIGLAIGIAVAWGLFFFQLAQGGLSSFEINALLAYAIAATIITVVLFILDILGLGIIGMILALIDAILAILGEQSATDWLTEKIAEALYDVHMVIKNLDSSDRLDINLKTFDFTAPALGFSVNNSFIFSYGVTNTLKFNDRFERDTAEYRSTFVYDLQTDSESDRHEDLDAGDMSDEWIDAGEEYIQTTDRMTITVPIGGIGTGLNQQVDLYLIESYYTSFEGCWFIDGFGIRIGDEEVATVDACDWGKTTGSVPIYLGDSLVYDILPQSVQEFARMDWDDLLPAQVDEDADGLPSTDGTDPNENDADTDGDGLLDTYEVSYGLDSQDADADGDGLNDAEELALDTNPLASDTDGDGLNDYIETQEGWLIIYDGNQLTRVYSDPNTADFDEDGLDDLDEFLFGFNPWVATDPSIIETLVEFEDLTVEENTNLQMLLRMEENATAENFYDSSGRDVSGSCDAADGQCPTAEVTGRYGNGLWFDGDDTISTDLALDVETFTMAAWIYNTAGDDDFKAIMGTEVSGLDTRGPSMWVYQKTKIHAGVSGGTWTHFTTGDVLTQNQWQHVAATFDGETFRMYVDGVEVYDDNSFSGIDPIAFSDYDIGAVNNGRHFEGSMDEVAFFDRALTETEVNALMNGRYNANDLYAAPGASLNYRATITNSTSTNATGFLVPETGYIEPELPDPLLALSFEEDQRLVYFENSIETDDAPFFCTVAEDACPTTGQEGQIGVSIAFDGVNDYLEMPGLIGRYDGGFAVLFWLYVESIPSSGEIDMILDTESTAEGAMDIYLNSDGKLVIDSAELGTITSGYNFGNNLNKWVHVAYNQNKLFINYSENGNSLSGAEAPLTVGSGRLGNSMDGSSPFHGRIDELVVVNTGLEDGSGGSATSVNEVEMIAGGQYTLHEGDDDQTLVVPEAVYSLEELTEFGGTIFYNDITTGTNATCTPPACPELTESSEGYSGRAILFDGVDDTLTQGGSTITSEYADYNFYIKPLSYPAAGEVAYLYDTTATGEDENYSLNLYMDENGYVHYENDVFSLTTTAAVALDQWSQVRMWYNGNASSYNVRLSVNGSQVNSSRCAISYGCRDEMQFIGSGTIGNNNASDSPFHGYIDEVSIVIAEYDFEALSNSIGYENVANDLRSASCNEYSICASVTDGKYGKGVGFDGVDDFLNLGNIFDSVPASFTLGLWFKMDALTTDDDYILAQTDGTSTGQMWLAVTEDTGEMFSYLTGPHLSGGYPTLGEWNYATFTYDGTTLRLYLNGVEISSTTTAPIISDGDVLMGISKDSDFIFKGAVDEMIVLKEAADTDQINFLMASTYPALEIANDFETYTASPLSAIQVSGTATIADNLPTSRYQFDLEAEAALELQTQIDFPVIDDNSGDVSVFIPFEDTPGSTIFDNLIQYDGEDVEAQCYNDSCPTAGVRGIIGRAVSFDGLDDFIEMDVPNGISPIPGITSASMWVKGKKGTIFDSRSSVVDDNAVRIDFGHVYQYAVDGDNNISTYQTSFSLPIDEWTHLAFSIDTGTDTGTVYVNGQSVATGTHFSDSESDLWTIGANFGQQNFFEGLIDDLRVYETTLTSNDVLALYQTSGPIMRFEFDEDDTATSFADESPNGHVGYPLTTTAFDSTLNETVTTMSPSPGTDGKIGNTALFDGSGYIDVPNTGESTDFNEDFTFMAWLKTSEENSAILAKADDDTSWESGESGFMLLSGYPRILSNGKGNIVGNTNVADDVWHHVAIVWDRDGSNTSGTGRVFIDGVESTDWVNYRSETADNATDTIKIGAPPYTHIFDNFEGQLDELAIYGRALTEAEINGIYLQEYRWYRATSYNEVQVDLDAPVIEYLSDADYRTEGYIQLSVATRDTHSYINTFDFGVKGPNDSSFSWQSAPLCGEAIVSGSAWCPNFTTADYGGEGVYEVQFRAVDAVGNETTSSSYTIYVDGQAPTSTTSYSEPFMDATETDSLNWTIGLSGNVSDPEIATGVAGSGVVSSTVQLGLLDSSGGLIEDGWQTVTVTNTDWTIDYQFSGERPSGVYSITLSAVDELGNASTLDLGTIKFDERAPSARVNDWGLPTEMISETTTISGTVVEQPEWGDAIAEYHFETDAADTTFYDSSGYDYHVACTGTDDCPTADLTGAFGQALTFDGVDDYMAATGDSPDLSEESFTVAAWVNYTDNGDWQNIIGQKDTVSTSEGWVLRLNQDKSAALFVANGSSTWSATSNSVIPENEWHHLVGVVDRDDNELRLYVNGVLVDTETGLSGSLSTTDLTIGRWSSYSEDFFNGSMDEVYIFERELNETEIYALAQDDVQGVASVEVMVEEQDLSTVVENGRSGNSAALWKFAPANSGSWESANVSNGEWDYELPSNTEGFYTVELRATDNNGNTSDEGVIWRGSIDDVEPRINAYGRQIGGNGVNLTEYNVTFTDFILDTESLVHPCGDDDETVYVYSDDSLPQNGAAYEVRVSCTVDGHETSRDFTGCDVFGLCITVTVTPTFSNEGAIIIDSPVNGATIIQDETVTVSGVAYDPSMIAGIELYANGAPIGNMPLDPEDGTFINWSFEWTPTQIEDVDLRVRMLGTTTKEDEITVSVIQDPLDDLAVSLSGTGDGVVTSDPDGIACGSDCDERFANGTVVTLTASANTGSTFTSWSGDCTGSGDCVVTVDDTKNVAAEFTLNQYDLTVTNTGSGAGTITSVGNSIIDCGSDCSETLDYGTVVTLTAAAGAESQFTGWSGECSGTADCVVTINEAKSVSADFALNQYGVTTVVIGDGNGTVTSNPAGITCGADCAESFDYGTAVTLTATADGSSVFTGWEGDCSGSDCVVTIDGSKAVTATFVQDSYDLTLSLLGDGTGTITSDPAGISCEADCAETYAYNTVVTLTASYDDTQMALTWGGSCASAVGDSCVVTMDQAQSATATLTLGSFSLGTNILGNGNGSVLSDPVGISCNESGGTCNAPFTASQTITLTPTAGLESVFSGWSGICSGTGNCVVTLTQTEQVSATFTLNQYDVTVTTAGDGEGTVTSTPTGIDCGSTCTTAADYGSMITLTAAAGTESQFDSWTGACSGSSNVCTVTVDQAKSVTANFSLNQYELTVGTDGTGDGLITSNPSGISCGNDCSELFTYGTEVTLSATSNSGSVFSGWSGVCAASGTADCITTIDQAQSVIATFTILTHTLSVSSAGTGSGSVTSDPTGINCGDTCAADFDHNMLVVLTASPESGSTFEGWSGACSGTSTCVVTMDQAQAVTAEFSLIPSDAVAHTLSVTLAGAGSGSVSSNPAGISCGTDCTADYVENTLVTLTASPAVNSTFEGWSGACSGTSSCIVTMSQAQAVTATFKPMPTNLEYSIFVPFVRR